MEDNSIGKTPTLPEIFGYLETELLSISRSSLSEFDGTFRYASHMQRIEKDIFYHDKLMVFEYLENILFKIDELRRNLDKIVDEIPLEKFEYEEVYTPKKYTLEEKKEKYRKGRLSFLNYYYEELSSLSLNFLPKNSNFKIKTYLSVPELAYLFNCLFEEKGILDEKVKQQLYKKIANNFSSKKTKNISPKSIYNNTTSLNAKAVNFWHEKFTHLMQIAKKDLENI